MSYKICVALQIRTGNLEENKALIEKALDSEADLIELRLDYIDDVSRITQEFVDGLLTLIQPNVPAILTFRDVSEGGHSQIDNEKRVEIIKLLVKAKPVFLDIEMNTDPQVLIEIINLAILNKVKIIFSCHDFIKTPTFEAGKELIMDFLKKLVTFSTQTTDNSGPFVYKAVFKANTFEDNIVPLKLCRFYTKMGEDRNFVCFSMGDRGVFSRVMCVKAGSSFTYGSIEHTTAPGQINIKKIREMHQLLLDN